MTHPVFRAAVFFAVEDLEREQARPDQPKVKVATQVLFEERIARFKALDAQTWPLSRLAGQTA